MDTCVESSRKKEQMLKESTHVSVQPGEEGERGLGQRTSQGQCRDLAFISPQESCAQESKK